MRNFGLGVESGNQSLVLGVYEKPFRQALETLRKNDFVRRLWAKDPSLWKSEPDHAKIIRNSLGWLTVP
ncbi:MAG: hypothetical protein HYY63_07320, partial [Elusimicrobia bacterium]|nr:hypothetical protein [Elusimicrobiota bacterium]